MRALRGSFVAVLVVIGCGHFFDVDGAGPTAAGGGANATTGGASPSAGPGGGSREQGPGGMGSRGASSGSGAAGSGGGAAGSGGGGGAAGTIDLGGGGAAGAANTSCSTQYGLAPGYEECPMKSGHCMFNLDSNGGLNGICESVCSNLGGECIAAWDNLGPCELIPAGSPKQVACGYSGYSSLVCECSLGCGTGPPCPAMTCKAGMCS